MSKDLFISSRNSPGAVKGKGIQFAYSIRSISNLYQITKPNKLFKFRIPYPIPYPVSDDKIYINIHVLEFMKIVERGCR